MGALSLTGIPAVGVRAVTGVLGPRIRIVSLVQWGNPIPVPFSALGICFKWKTLRQSLQYSWRADRDERWHRQMGVMD